MTWRLQVQHTSGGQFFDLDVVSLLLGGFKYHASYEHPTMLTFLAYQDQQSLRFGGGGGNNLGIMDFIKCWEDDQNGPNGQIQSATNPFFEGFIWDMQPTATNTITLTAYDATQMAGREVPIFSSPWQDAATPALGSVPRLVFNCFDITDDDFSFQRNNGGPLTVGNMIATVFDDATLPITYFNACAQNDRPYVSSELNVFTYYPIYKDVFESMQLGACIRQLMTYIPDFKMFFEPGARHWHFWDPTQAPTVNLQLNQSQGQATAQVLHLDLHRSLDGRAGAVQFIGPETTVLEQFYLSLSQLQPFGASTILENYSDSTGMHQTLGYSAYQIADPTLRRGSHLLPRTLNPVYVGMPVGWFDPTNNGTFQFIPVVSPQLEFSYDNGSTWSAVVGCTFDYQQGVVSLNGGFIYKQITPPPNPGTQTIFLPTDLRLTWASYAQPIQVRYPSSGYGGTFNSVANGQTVAEFYEENLQVGVNDFGIPVTTSYRIAQITELAKHQQQYRQDIVYTGGVVLDGIRYEFSQLNRRVNFSSQLDGALITTGFETINAIVSDCILDFHNQTTTLLFSSDLLKITGVSIDEMTRRLGADHKMFKLTDHWISLYADMHHAEAWVVSDTRFVDATEFRFNPAAALAHAQKPI